MPRTSVLFLIPIALLSVACGSSENSAATTAAPATASASAPAARREACSLITVDEAARILGSPTTATARAGSADGSTCDYVTQAFESFTLGVKWEGAEEGVKAARTAAGAATNAAGGASDAVVNEVMGLRRVANLGDEAYFARRGQSYVRRGDVLLSMQTSGLNDPALERFEALMRAALARI